MVASTRPVSSRRQSLCEMDFSTKLSDLRPTPDTISYLFIKDNPLAIPGARMTARGAFVSICESRERWEYLMRAWHNAPGALLWNCFGLKHFLQNVCDKSSHNPLRRPWQKKFKKLPSSRLPGREAGAGPPRLHEPERGP